MSLFISYRFIKYGVSFLTAGLLLLQTAIAQKAAYEKGFRVKDNVMYITISKNLPTATLDSFIQSYSLRELGLYSLIKTGKMDSVIGSGWKLEQAGDTYIITKALTAGTDMRKSGDRIVFSSIPTREEWRIVGDNRIVYGANHFKNGAAFRREGDITYFVLRGHKNARSVKLAGSFTDWQGGAFPMKQTADGWEVPVRLQPGQYFYKFIINEWDWQTDPDNRLEENDGRANMNSVYFVPNKTFMLKGYTNAKSVFLSGSFNNWGKSGIPLTKTGTGWVTELYLGGGTHKYHYIVDGKIVQENENAQEDAQVKFGNETVFKLKGFNNAKKVVLAGNFNDWKEDEIRLNRMENGWTVSYVLGPGNYQYKFIVDGNWMIDPLNNNKVSDENGNQNSFVVVAPNYTFRLKGYGTAKRVNLAGEFNNWSPEGLPMTKVGDEWVCPVYIGRGKHLYKFIVDGKWIRDPNNPLWEDGDNNSVLWVE